ncbi:MAG: hypothetical protein GY792_35610 [Gammaproteobacteria bacterium]|nr:hypothetical protein [Gammaproteobacteria bacterium]
MIKKLLQATTLTAIGLVGTTALAQDPCVPGSPSYTSGLYEAELPLNSGITRSFRVHVPPSYYDSTIPQETPVVLMFHGWGGDEDSFLSSPTVISEADQRGAILVAPRGLGSGAPDGSYNSWSFLGSTDGLDADDGPVCNVNNPYDYTYPSCAPVGKKPVAKNICSWTHCQSDDVLFATDLIDEISHNLCVDKSKVFAVGGSNGGMFTWNLGQDPRSAGHFRAISTLIGQPHRGYLSAKATTKDLPVLAISGTEDTTVPPGEWEDPGFTTSTAWGENWFYASATGITRSWAEAHNCPVKKKASKFKNHQSGYDCRTYCKDDMKSRKSKKKSKKGKGKSKKNAGWPRVLDCRTSLGHVYDLDQSWPLIMDFFEAHSED